MVHGPVPHSQAQGWGWGWGWHRHVSFRPHLQSTVSMEKEFLEAHGQRSHLRKKNFRESRATPAGYTAEDNFKLQILLPPSVQIPAPGNDGITSFAPNHLLYAVLRTECRGSCTPGKGSLYLLSLILSMHHKYLKMKYKLYPREISEVY